LPVWCFFVALLVYTVAEAAASGWRSALLGVFFLSIFQLQILYALRRLVLRGEGTDIAAGDPNLERKHFLWMIVTMLVGASVSVGWLVEPNRVPRTAGAATADFPSSSSCRNDALKERFEQRGEGGRDNDEELFEKAYSYIRLYFSRSASRAPCAAL
jgi:hypothetical protein